MRVVCFWRVNERIKEGVRGGEAAVTKQAEKGDGASPGLQPSL